VSLKSGFFQVFLKKTKIWTSEVLSATISHVNEYNLMKMYYYLTSERILCNRLLMFVLEPVHTFRPTANRTY